MTDELNQIINKVLQSIDISRGLDKARDLTRSIIQNNFLQRGRWNGVGVGLLDGGNKRWKELAPLTKASYKRKGYELVATLNRSNNGLYKSIDVQIAGKKGLRISANRPYAEIHQKGGVINHTGGTPFFVSASKGAKPKAIFITKKKADQLLAKGRVIRYTAPHKIIIPARPYLTLSPEDIEEIINILVKYSKKL